VTLFKIIYWAGILAEVVIRAPFSKSRLSVAKTERRVSPTERVLLGLLTVAGVILPLLYTFTPWLSFVNYRLPAWLGWLGVFMLACALFVFARAHIDLKSNWSPSLEIYADHTLISNGIYAYIRHPMYASLGLIAIAQTLLLQNWLAGPLNLIVFILFYVFRIQAEERMMLDRFGEAYRAYMQRTGRILPKF
jgi:protein-S-isoprenylcysteine O-methyltransferase Ste14